MLRLLFRTLESDQFPIEIFDQNIPSTQQNAFKHMIVEKKILDLKGENFSKRVIELKRKGLKTEPALAELLGHEGNPHEGLLNLDIY